MVSNFLTKSFAKLALFAFAMPLALVAQTAPQTFSSPQEAGSAFFEASQARDDQALLKILGPDGKDIISSGDAAEDSASRARFVEKYRQMHRFASEPDGTLTLFVGAENWPLPIPLVHKNNVWYFDASAGKSEILYRRIGRNEIAAMDACLTLVQAEKDYFAHHATGAAKQYTRQLTTQDGHLITGSSTPFNGYYFRILTAQGQHVTGGPKTFLSGDKLTGGFAIIAYPASYRSSGVMTFIVDAKGSIYEKDLGSDTASTASAMTAFDPDATWNKTEN